MKRTSFVRLITIFLVLLIFSGCGGSSRSYSITLNSEGARDGYTNTTASNSDSNIIIIGDDNSNGCWRGCVSFNLGSISRRARVRSAVLKIYQTEVAPVNDSYANLGPVKVDHLYYGDIFDTSACTLLALSYIGTLATSYSAGWKTIDVTAAVQNDVNNSRAYSQFRFFHDSETSDPGRENSDSWYSGDNDTLQPQLQMSYTR
jgi:hypothetical protein